MINDNGVIRKKTDQEVKECKARQAEFERQYWLRTSYEDAVNAIIRGDCPVPVNIPNRKTYTLSNELAILRQKDEKPEQHAEYFAACEAAKAYAKEQIARFGGAAK